MPYHIRFPQRSWHEWNWFQLAVVAWLVVAIATCGRALLIPFSERHIGIYPVYGNAGKDWVQGKDLYGYEDNIFTYRYSPLMAVFLIPLGQMSVVAGSFCWRLTNLLVLLVGLRAWEKTCFPSTWTRAHRGKFYLLAAPLSAPGLIDGQANPLLLGLVLLSLAWCWRGHWWLASTALVLAFMVKLYPIAAALLLVLLWPRELGWRFPVALLAGFAFPFLFRDPAWVFEQYRGWARIVLADGGRQDWPLDSSYRDLRLLVRYWFVPLSPFAYTLIQGMSALGLALLTCLARWRTGRTSQLATLVTCLGCCWMLIVGPCSEACTYVLVAGPLAWAIVEANSKGSPIAVRWALGMAFVLLNISPMAAWFPGGKQLQSTGMHPFATLLIAGCLLAWMKPLLVRVETATATRPGLAA